MIQKRLWIWYLYILPLICTIIEGPRTISFEIIERSKFWGFFVTGSENGPNGIASTKTDIHASIKSHRAIQSWIFINFFIIGIHITNIFRTGVFQSILFQNTWCQKQPQPEMSLAEMRRISISPKIPKFCRQKLQ